MRARNDGMLFLVPLFCFMSVLSLEKDMFVSFVSPVFLFSCSQNCLHFCTQLSQCTHNSHVDSHVAQDSKVVSSAQKHSHHHHIMHVCT